jgi:hypothetical protein
MQIADTLGFLLGEWQVTRSIDDRRQGVTGWFEGTASFEGTAWFEGTASFEGTAWFGETPDGDQAPPGRGGGPGSRARYLESGELHLGSHTGLARRRLECRRLHDLAVMLHFSDGRPFVDLDLRSGAWRSDYLCGEDRYQLSTVVHSRDVVRERWRVEGPTKDYEAVTTLTRDR